MKDSGRRQLSAFSSPSPRPPTACRRKRDGIALLVRAVATQYRLSPKARKDLADRMAAVLNSIGDQILPANGGAE
jgi:hypothetical protein